MSKPDTNLVMNEVLEVKKKLGLSNSQMCKYLGVPHSTLMGWLSGKRNPSSCALRLLDVLAALRAFAPEAHELFIPGSTKE